MKNLIIYYRLLFVVVLFCTAASELSGQKVVTDSASVSPFGKVFLYSGTGDNPVNLIIMISGDGGWKAGVPEFAKEFAGNGSVVAGIDILRYYRQLRQRESDCYLVASDFVEMATAIEKKYNFPEYNPPIIMGYSSGATLVYGILSQARPGTFMGGISLGFCPDIELPKVFCEINGLKTSELVKGKSFILDPDPQLGNPWIILHGRKDRVCDFQAVTDFVSKTANARLIALPEVGHGFSKWSDFMPQWKAATADLIAKFHEKYTAASQIPDLKNIPYVLLREQPANSDNTVALFLSGDGGWYGFEQSISRHLGDSGIPVIGIDLKKFLWNRITPEKAASDIARLLEYYGKKWNKTEYLLIGYSQGAEIVPFIFNRLPDNIRENVISVVMLSPAATTDFKVHITDMLGLGNKQDTYNVISEITKIQEPRKIVLFGESEKTGVPLLLKDDKSEIVRIPGDHHFNGNTNLIVKKLKESNAF